MSLPLPSAVHASAAIGSIPKTSADERLPRRGALLRSSTSIAERGKDPPRPFKELDGDRRHYCDQRENNKHAAPAPAPLLSPPEALIGLRYQHHKLTSPNAKPNAEKGQKLKKEWLSGAQNVLPPTQR